jgi:hypothetical protein
VSRIVHRVGVAIDGIDAVAIVDVTVGIRVDQISIAIRVVAEHVGREILVRVIDTGVDHGDHHVARARLDVPGFVRGDVRHYGRWLFAELARIAQPDLPPELRVIGHDACVVAEIGFDVLDVVLYRQRRHRAGGVAAFTQRNEPQPRHAAKLALRTQRGIAQRLLQCGSGNTGLELDEELTGHDTWPLQKLLSRVTKGQLRARSCATRLGAGGSDRSASLVLQRAGSVRRAGGRAPRECDYADDAQRARSSVLRRPYRKATRSGHAPFSFFFPAPSAV